jgi:hypothetical protein
LASSVRPSPSSGSAHQVLSQSRSKTASCSSPSNLILISSPVSVIAETRRSAARSVMPCSFCPFACRHRPHEQLSRSQIAGAASSMSTSLTWLYKSKHDWPSRRRADIQMATT